MIQRMNRLACYVGGRAHHVFEGFTRDLSESRVILNWMYCFAYLALIFYCAVNNPASHNAAIYTTGGIVSTIFTVYILGSSYEKVQKMRNGNGHRPAEEIRPEMSEDEQKDAAGD